jgi:hypothetical protein
MILASCGKAAENPAEFSKIKTLSLPCQRFFYKIENSLDVPAMALNGRVLPQNTNALTDLSSVAIVCLSHLSSTFDPGSGSSSPSDSSSARRHSAGHRGLARGLEKGLKTLWPIGWNVYIGRKR